MYAFLDDARLAGATIVHAVSDSKMHYLNDPAVAPFVLLAKDVAPSERAPQPAHEWDWLSRTSLLGLNPPPPLSLNVGRVCGSAGAELFNTKDKRGSKGRKPENLPGLQATFLKTGDVVAAELDAVYAAVMRRRPTRIFFVGVHLDLCLLYSRWFSALRVAARWDLPPATQLAYIVPLVDVSNSDADEPDVTKQVDRDPVMVARMACWIRCVASPQLLSRQNVVDLYDLIMP